MKRLSFGMCICEWNLTRLMLYHCVISPDLFYCLKNLRSCICLYYHESISIRHIHAGIWLSENYITSSGNRVAWSCGLPRGCWELKWVSSKVKIILYYSVIPRVLHSLIFIRSFFRLNYFWSILDLLVRPKWCNPFFQLFFYLIFFFTILNIFKI